VSILVNVSITSRAESDPSPARNMSGCKSHFTHLGDRAEFKSSCELSFSELRLAVILPPIMAVWARSRPAGAVRTRL